MTDPVTVTGALGLPFEEAIAYLRDKTNLTSTGWTDVWQRANAKAFTVAGATTQALVEDFRREVARALETGSSIQEFRKTFDAIVKKHGWEHVGKPGWRARVIYETNLGTAYAAGRYAQQTEPATLRAFPYWQYVHSGARHPRLQHLAWNGLTLRADDPFWDWAYPPNGWGCGCRVRPVSARGLARIGKTRPDDAPARIRETTVNRRTGEVLEGSKGVDPGFDYNPGQVWKNAPRSSVPGLTADARETPVSRPAEVRAFAQDVLEGRITDLARRRVVARLPEDLSRALGGGASEIEIGPFRVLKVAGRAEELGGYKSTPHPEITPQDWADIAAIVGRAEVWLETPALGGARQLWFYDETGGRLRRLIVRRSPRQGGGERLIVPNFEEVGSRRKQREIARLKRLKD